jgi:hypothetical protein
MSVYPGNLLTVTAASVNAVPASTRTWAWLRNNTAIPAQTSTTYRITEADIGTVLAAQQTETNFVGATSVSSAQIGPIQTFSPSLLFAAGEQGVWFDPSDVANLNWRRNLLVWTERFDHPDWANAVGPKPTVTPNAAVAPDGTLTADLLNFSAQYQAVSQGNRTIGTVYTESVWMRVDSGTRTINLTSAEGIIRGTFTVTTSWQRFSTTYTASNFSAGWQDRGVSGFVGVYIWGAQLELGSVATDYQRITDVNTEVIERFPNATLYQDTAGTTPVTTTGQSVGLMLDKSKGLVLGPELGNAALLDKRPATDGTVTRSGGIITFTSTASGLSTAIAQEITGLIIGNTYRFNGRMRRTVGAASPGQPQIRTASGGGGSSLLNGPSIGSEFTSFSIFWVATQTSAHFSFSAGAVSQTIEVDEAAFSVRELAGNHAVQATTANRPIYGIHPFGGRRNLLVRTEEFENAAWTPSGPTVVANTSTAPNGTLTADLLRSATSVSGQFINDAGVSTSATTHTTSVYLKASGYSWAILYVAGPNVGVHFDVQNGVVGSTFVGAPTSSSITPVGNGWFRCSITFTATTVISSRIYIRSSDGGGAFAGDGTSGILMWGAQIETGSTATAYQRVTDQYNVTEAGVPSVSYLFFNGNNFSMATPSINFTKNLVTFPTAFDNPAWELDNSGAVNPIVTANAAVAPDGTMTADRIQLNKTGGTFARIQQINMPTLSSATYTFSVWLRKNGPGTSNVGIRIFADGVNCVVTETWQRFSVSLSAPATTATPQILLFDSIIGNDETADIFAWGAQVELGSSATEFQSLVSNGKMTVFAGVRKLSDAATGMIAELSSTFDTAAGVFSFAAPVTGATYGSTIRGGASPATNGIFASTFTAPISNVVTLQYDLAQASATAENLVRVNGVVPTLSTPGAAAGSGIFGNHPLYIGHRFNNPPTTPSSLFFSGHLYSLIVRGAQSNSIFTTAPEAWVAGKTGVVIA